MDVQITINVDGAERRGSAEGQFFIKGALLLSG